MATVYNLDNYHMYTNTDNGSKVLWKFYGRTFRRKENELSECNVFAYAHACGDEKNVFLR
jgi:hypothetical protein